MSQHSRATPATGALVAALLAAGSGAVVTLSETPVQLALVAAIAYAVLLAGVATATSPRSAAVRVIALLATLLTYSGISLAPRLSLDTVVPLLMLPFAFLPKVATDAADRELNRWVLAVPLLMAAGGAMAATEPGSNLAPLLTFTSSALCMTVMLYRIHPTRAESLVLLHGLVLGVAVSTTLGLIVMRAPSGRAIGLTDQPNQYAMFAVLALPLVWLLVREAGLPKGWGVGVSVVVVAGVFESGSRSGVLALTAVVLIASFRRWGIPVTAALGTVVGAAAVGLGVLTPLTGTPAVERLLDSSATERSNTTREQYMSSALEAILDGNYLFGTGFQEDHLPHNVVLLIWGGMGLLGLLAFGALLWRLLPAVMVRRRTDFEAALSLAALGFLVAVSLNNLISAASFWLIVGLFFFTDRADLPVVGVPAPAAGRQRKGGSPPHGVA